MHSHSMIIGFVLGCVLVGCGGAPAPKTAVSTQVSLTSADQPASSSSTARSRRHLLYFADVGK